MSIWKKKKLSTYKKIIIAAVTSLIISAVSLFAYKFKEYKKYY